MNMINQKLVQRAIFSLKRALQLIYFLGTLWLGLIFIITIPLWAPIYLFTSSMCRSISFLKRIIDLPNQLFRTKITQPIRYAILKGNGKYLRNTAQQDAFLFQLYDYTMRKFLSIQKIEPDTKISEVQCETLSQWKYFKSNGMKNIKCLQSRPQILDKQKDSLQGIQIKKQNYQIQQFSNQMDIIIAHNLKQKLNKHTNKQDNQQKIDILKILGYIRHHLSENGYAIYGDFFDEEGEVAVLEELFSVYGFKIKQSQNIQKNISYAQKLLTYKAKKYWEQQLLDKIVRKVKHFLHLKRDSNKFFVVFILSKKNIQNE